MEVSSLQLMPELFLTSESLIRHQRSPTAGLWVEVELKLMEVLWRRRTAELSFERGRMWFCGGSIWN